MICCVLIIDCAFGPPCSVIPIPLRVRSPYLTCCHLTSSRLISWTDCLPILSHWSSSLPFYHYSSLCTWQCNPAMVINLSNPFSSMPFSLPCLNHLTFLFSGHRLGTDCLSFWLLYFFVQSCWKKDFQTLLFPSGRWGAAPCRVVIILLVFCFSWILVIFFVCIFSTWCLW